MTPNDLEVLKENNNKRAADLRTKINNVLQRLALTVIEELESTKTLETNQLPLDK